MELWQNKKMRLLAIVLSIFIIFPSGVYSSDTLYCLEEESTGFYKEENSESFNIARHQYIKGYQDKNEHIFPTLDLVAKEFSLTLSTLRKKAANEGWYQKRKQVWYLYY